MPQQVASEEAGLNVEERNPGRAAQRGGSLKSQLVAIQHAIEAIEGSGAPAAGRGRKKAVKTVARRKRTMTEEQRQAVAERMRKYWAARREEKAEAEKPEE